MGLLDVEATFSPSTRDFRLRGRGSAHGEAWLGPVSLVGELDLRDTDVDALRGRPVEEWLRPRVARLERAPDPDRVVPEWADTSVGLTPNASESRLRLEARHAQLGRLGLGTYRAQLEEGEVGRYHRPLFGPYAELGTDVGPVRVGLKAFGGALADPLHALSALPAYEELRATGGSLYYLGSTPVAEGSEALRVEVRDGVTGLPLHERHLLRGVDYEIDYAAGRVLLARPLSFVEGEAWLSASPPRPRRSRCCAWGTRWRGWPRPRTRWAARRGRSGRAAEAGGCRCPRCASPATGRPTRCWPRTAVPGWAATAWWPTWRAARARRCGRTTSASPTTGA